jgi:hypothetical protein
MCMKNDNLICFVLLLLRFDVMVTYSNGNPLWTDYNSRLLPFITLRLHMAQKGNLREVP